VLFAQKEQGQQNWNVHVLLKFENNLGKMLFIVNSGQLKVESYIV